MSICLTDGAVTNVYLGGGGTGTGSSVELKFENPKYGPGQELDSKPGTKKRMKTSLLFLRRPDIHQNHQRRMKK